MSAEYDIVVNGKLKLKSDLDVKKGKTAKKNKTGKKLKKNYVENFEESYPKQQKVEAHKKPTKAEVTFKKMREKMENKRILEKAAMTHKQKVEKFNRHLDNLSEHYDIPKVSWTK